MWLAFSSSGLLKWPVTPNWASQRKPQRKSHACTPSFLPLSSLWALQRQEALIQSTLGCAFMNNLHRKREPHRPRWLHALHFWQLLYSQGICCRMGPGITFLSSDPSNKSDYKLGSKYCRLPKSQEGIF